MPKATTLTTNANLNTNTGLGYFKLHDHAPTPQFSTKESCCFDLAFNAAGNRVASIASSVRVLPSESLFFDAGEDAGAAFVQLAQVVGGGLARGLVIHTQGWRLSCLSDATNRHRCRNRFLLTWDTFG